MIYIDFEYNQPQERSMGLVCCSLTNSKSGFQMNYWLHNNEVVREELRRYLTDHQKEIICAYTASAEARCFIALGLDPMDWKWLDLYAEWRCLKMNNNNHSYGRYLRKQPSIVNGKIDYKPHGYSVPPSLNPKDNEGKDNTEVGNGLVDCAYHLLGVNMDAKHKDEMRDLILSRPDEFTFEQAGRIMEYCSSDIKHLHQLQRVLETEIRIALKLSHKQYKDIAINRARYCGPAIAHIESNGIPFDLESANNLSANVRKARNAMLASYASGVELSFYCLEKPTRKVFSGKWVEKYDLFETYIKSKPQYKEWPLTDAGQLSRENDVLKENDGDPNIAAYRQVRKALRGLQSFDPKSKSARESGIVMDAVGEDGRLRTMFGVIGTQTGRNAPRARKFPFAMGSWARSLIKPPEGYVIVAIDWSNQEFAIAAVLSGDKAMLEAYNSGDPYLYFAKAAKAVPADATKDSHPAERNLFKSTTLGLQFGMGVEKLARKLTVDCGREVTEKEAGKLVALHKRIYKVYWKWTKKVGYTYERHGFLMLKDGFALNGHCNRMTSVRNFPVQGTGAVILRQATVNAVEDGVPVISPLHDALYACCRIEDKEAVAAQLSAAMSKACIDVLGFDIRQDLEFHTTDEVWVEKRGKAVYEALAPFYTSQESETEIRARKLKEFYDV